MSHDLLVQVVYSLVPTTHKGEKRALGDYSVLPKKETIIPDWVQTQTTQ